MSMRILPLNARSLRNSYPAIQPWAGCGEPIGGLPRCSSVGAGWPRAPSSCRLLTRLRPAPRCRTSSWRGWARGGGRPVVGVRGAPQGPWPPPGPGQGLSLCRGEIDHSLRFMLKFLTRSKTSNASIRFEFIIVRSKELVVMATRAHRMSPAYQAPAAGRGCCTAWAAWSSARPGGIASAGGGPLHQ
jgi:hypothetical protein